MLHAISGPFVKGIWFALDGLRKVLHLVLLLVLFGLLIVASQSEIPTSRTARRSCWRPRAQIVEELSGDPLDRALSRASGQSHAEIADT